LKNNETSQRIEKTLSENLDQLTNMMTALNLRVVETHQAATAPAQQAGQPQEATEAAADVLAQIKEETKALEASRQLYQDLLEKIQEVVAESQAGRARGRGGNTYVKFNGRNDRGLQMGVNEGTMNNLRFG
jgi:inactivated superfamily I helicase